MSTCGKCAIEVASLFYQDEKWLCKDCYSKPDLRVDPKAYITLPSGSKMSVGYRDEIHSRKVHVPTGEVYHEVGRKSIRL